MPEFKCSTCGGELSLSLNSEYAVCENCGNTVTVDSDELARIRRVYKDAELKTHMNTAEGYSAAINELEGIAFVNEAREKIVLFEKRLDELKEKQARRAEAKEKADKNDGKIGIMILAAFLILIVIALSGAGYIIYSLIAGSLSPTATAAIIISVVILAILVIIGKIKS